MRKRHFFLGLTLTIGLSLTACQSPSLTPQQFSPEHAIEQFSDLEAEYAPFTTQALTQNYLERKLNRWVNQSNGEAMKRELLFAEFKHPATLTQALDTPTLCASALGFPEVSQARSNSPNLDSLLQSVSCGNPDYIGEFQVNTTTENGQGKPKVAADQNGNFVVVWESFNHDGDANGIFAQRFNADGTQAGGEFQVNTYTVSEQNQPAIDMSSDGRFVVTWASNGQDGSNYGVFAQRFNADGTKAGGEIQVNTTTTGHQSTPDIAMAGDGRFAITWASSEQDGDGWGVYAQRFNADGTKAGGETLANTSTDGSQFKPAIDMAEDGYFVVGWVDSNLSSVAVRSFLPDGSAEVANEYLVDTTVVSLSAYHKPDVLLYGAEGSRSLYVVYPKTEASGFYSDIYFAEYKRFSGDGGQYTFAPRQVNTEYTEHNQTAPRIRKNGDGAILITWASIGQDRPQDPLDLGYGNSGIYGKVYTDGGRSASGARTDAFRINTHTPNSQFYPDVAGGGDDLIVVWESREQDAGPATSGLYSNLGVFGQRMRSDIFQANNEVLTWK